MAAVAGFVCLILKATKERALSNQASRDTDTDADTNTVPYWRRGDSRERNLLFYRPRVLASGLWPFLSNIAHCSFPP